MAAAVRCLQPDVVALQEIDAREEVAADLDTFDYLRSSLGWHSVDARTIKTPRGDYGHAVLTPWTVDVARCMDISVPGFEPRAAIYCAIRELGVHVIATHLGLRARERRRQIERIVAAAHEIGNERVIVLGDFNEWRRIGLATRKLCPPFNLVGTAPSFPAWRPVFALDRIWCGPGLEPLAGRAGRHMANLSDHLPILADLRRVVVTKEVPPA